MEHRKCGNPDYPEVGKSEINEKPKPIKKKKPNRDSLLDAETCTLRIFNLTNKHAVNCLLNYFTN